MATAQPAVPAATEETTATADDAARAHVVEAPEAALPSCDDTMLELAIYHLSQQHAVLSEQSRRLAKAHDPDALHEIRIATRRLRAALKAFETLLPDRSGLHADLLWLANTLGAARDRDVYIENAERFLERLPDPERRLASRHVDALRETRDGVRGDIERALRSSRHRAQLTRLEAFCREAASPAARRRWHSFRVCDGVDGYLEARLARVRRRAKRACPEAPNETLHALRIDIKKYRYLLELFEPMFGETLAEPLEAARKLQSALGVHQDACLAEQRLREHAATSDAATHEPAEWLALGRLQSLYADEAETVRARFKKLWKRFDAAQPRFPIED